MALRMTGCALAKSCRISPPDNDILMNINDTDLQLLAQYAQHQAEDAFAEIVRRHLDLVYSAALRQVRCPQLAEEVAQSVFTDLARIAHRLAAWDRHVQDGASAQQDYPTGRAPD